MKFWTVPIALFVLALSPLSAFGQVAALPKKAPPDALDGPPVVSAKAWAIADGKTGALLWGASETEPRAIASTTKIMTAFLVFCLAAQDAKVLDEVILVSERASKTSGSTARIQPGDRYAAKDLLYGLLLPSGNDAAVALAEHFGRRFHAKPAKDATADDHFAAFILEMNQKAKALKLTKTNYFDPHGNSKNQSCAKDLTVLAWHALQDEHFRKYVNTRRHTCEVINGEGEKRTAVWENTNRLLGIQGFDGVKTGTTTPAGACLVSTGTRGSDRLIVVVLGCTSSDGRYIDTRNLYRWAWREHTKPAKP